MAKCCQYCLTLEELSWQDFLIIFVFISEMILQLYPSWSQISHLTKNENMICNGMPKMLYVLFDVVQSASTQEVDDGQEEQAAPYGVILSQKEMKIKDKNLRIHRSPNEVSGDGIVADQKVAVRHGRLGCLLQCNFEQ